MTARKNNVLFIYLSVDLRALTVSTFRLWYIRRYSVVRPPMALCKIENGYNREWVD